MAEYGYIFFEVPRSCCLDHSQSPRRTQRCAPANGSGAVRCLGASRDADDIWVGVLTGSGERAFNAGAKAFAAKRNPQWKGK